jgi:hypothetical protein
VDRPSEIWNRVRRRWVLWTIGAVVIVAVLLGVLSGFYIDILWFREVGFSSVFWGIFWSKVLLALVFGAFFFVLLLTNLLLVRRLRPQYRIFSPEEEAVERYRTAFEPYARWVLPAVAALFALIAGTAVTGRWEEFQLWRVAGDAQFGIADPVFGRDVGFYVFSLPFLQFVQGWLFSSLVVITLVTAGAYYLYGGIRVRAVGERVTPQVKAHLSVLLGLIVLTKAWGYRLGQFDLLSSPRGTITGASFTDVNAHLPALRLLVVIAIVCAVLFLVNIRFRGWALPAIGIGLLALASVVAGAIFPAAVQRFRVAPQELQREREFIARNIEFTREAFGLDAVETRTFAAGRDVTAEDVEANRGVIENIRLWNPDVLRQSYLQLQRIRTYYEFPDVDVDRYVVEGEKRVVMLAPRQVAQQGIRGGGQTWQNQHLFYTHGYGVAASRVDEVTSEGAPIFLSRDIPPVGPLSPEEPRTYFQETSDVPFIVVNTEVEELDFPRTGATQEEFARTRYQGEGGIEIGGFFRQLLFAWRYRDVNLLISGLIDRESRIIINQDLPSRVPKIAPFLQYDGDPYAAIVGGRIVWIWDAYTVTDRYPYSERISLSQLTADNLSGTANYIRNSVKAVVDAVDGTTTYYVADEGDPIIRAWGEVFPDLLTPMSEAPAELIEHFRYPEDLFRIQAEQYANYHVLEPDQFYAKEDFWSVPVVAVDPTAETHVLDPYYVLTPLPGDPTDEPRFILFTPFTPAERPNMVAWMAAVSDPEQYGRLVSYEFPTAETVSGPAQVAGFISQDPEVSQQVTLLGQLGSDIIYGDLLTIPIGESFLYVQPLYLRSAQTATAIPELKRVVVVHGDRVTMAETLEEALAISFGEVFGQPPEGPTGPLPTDIAELLAEAQQHFENAEAALREGDLATYQREIEAAERAVNEAAERAQEPEPTPTP